LEGHRVVDAVGLADAVQVRQTRLSCDDGFDYNVLHLFHQLFGVSAFILQNFEDGTEGPFVAFISIFIISLLVILAVFVQRVVCQVHVHIVHVLFGRPLILRRAKASEGHLVKVDTQWRDSVQHNVDSQIIF
jgi:hypothetical protein